MGVTQNALNQPVVIAKPKAGEASVITLGDDQKVDFQFPLDGVKIDLRDIDLIVTFPDGASVVLLGFGLKLVEENPAELMFNGQPLDPQSLLAMVGNFVASDVAIPNMMSDQAKTVSKKDSKPESKQPEVVVVEVQAEPNNHKYDFAEQSKHEGDGSSDLTGSSDFTSPKKTWWDEPASSSSRSSTFTSNDSGNGDGDGDGDGDGNYDVPVPEILVRLFGVIESETTGGGQEIHGALAAEPADTDETYSVQAAVDTVQGTAGDNVIYADSPEYAGIGTTSRVVELTTTMPDTDWVITGVKISGLPEGYSIVGATLVNGSYVIDVDPANPDVISVVLQYVLPDGSTTADANGFYEYFALKLDYNITSASDGVSATTSGTVTFGIRDVASEADATYTNPVTQTPIYVLWSQPPGTSVEAGAGDDTVVAGAGTDTLNGGSGSDTLSYKMSNASVTVDLDSDIVSGGYAKGDEISSFENVEGTAFADILSGTQGANVFTGGDGADTLDGRGGIDTAKYGDSSDGVIVDLDAGTGVGGDAEGDVLISIENIDGSNYADSLTGDAGDNELYAGAGADVLVGAGGADLLDGGDGVDTADYSAATQGIAVDLTTGVGSAGDSAGDRLVSIETVVGTNLDDTITGSTAAETLKGGGGNDVLDGRDGADFLQGGDGDDVLTGGTGADTLNGGSGIDTAAYALSSAGVTVDLTTGTGNGGDAVGDTLVSVENLTGSALADILIGNGDANVLRGGDGNDKLRGGAGADVLDGEQGSDIADYSTSSGAVTIDLALGQASGGDAQGDTLILIENLIGSAMADTLTGDAGDNALSGAAGDDLLIGGGGADALAGGTGTDTVSYTGSAAAVTVDLTAGTAVGGDADGDSFESIENLVGSTYGDILRGDAGANVLSGGLGDDLLTGAAGADALDGGAGVDTASYAGSALGVTVDLATGYGQSGDAAGDRLTGIENLVGSDQADVLKGDANDNELLGGAGDDMLLGAGGADILDGGAGFDTISYAASSAAVTVDLGTRSASGGDATGDTLLSIEAVIGSDLDDTLKAGTSAASLSGGTGDDVLIGGVAADTLSGGAGDDLLTGGSGGDLLDGGSGNDTASYAESAAAVSVDLLLGTASGGDAQGDTLTSVESVTGSAYDDVLIGSAASNALRGGQGDDRLVGGVGADILDGGDGFDIADYGTSGFGVTVNFATGANGGGDAQGDTLIAIEKVIGSAYADSLTGGADDDDLAGAAGDDTLAGGAGNDRLDGGDGTDLLVGGAGNDVLVGGAGIDTASYATSQAGVQIDLLSVTGLGGDAAGDTLSGIENLIGSDYDDVLIGDAGANSLHGGMGNDRLEAGGGNDNLIGGSGDDVMIGGAGADTFQGGDGSDTVDYSTSTGAVGINLATRTGVGGDADGDSFFNMENVTGSSFDDTLTGNGAANVVTGGAGNDVIDAGAGDDTVDAGAGDDIVTGGAGADTLHGGTGTDILSYASSTAAVTVDLAAGAGLGGDAQGDVVDGFEEIQGSALGDTLLGSAGSDVLRGGSGDDLMRGRGGADVLDGGSGTDTADYADSSSAVQIDLNAGIASGGDAEGDTLISIERAIGSAHDDTLKAAAAGSVLDGGAGDDLFVAGAGHDALIGGAGSDTVDYTNSTAAVSVDLTAGSGLGGFAEGDTLSGIEQVLGSAYADTLTGNSSANILTGGSGNDTLAGLGGADVLDGGVGFDTLDYSASTAAVTIDFASGAGTGGDAEGDSFTGIEAVRGSALADRFVGDDDAHSIFGQGGDDTIVAGSGAETLDGGSGLDTVDYSASTAAVTVDLAAGTASGGFAAGDTLTSIEAVGGTAYDDTLLGSSGVNLLSGAAGNDRILGGAGADTLDGGAGTDTLDYSTSAAGVTINLLAGTAVGGDATGDTISQFENIVGSALADNLTGDAGANQLTGGGGNDVLAGLGGADVLDGGAGFDTVDYTASTAAVTVNLENGTASGGDGAGDTLTAIEGVTGSAFGDQLSGYTGSDRLDGGGGDDTLLGSLGADQLVGGAGSDTADYTSSTSGVAVALDGSAGVGGYAAGDTLSGIENLTGSALADSLTGDINANVLSGGDGDDVLAGLGDSDTLDGGTGSDTADYSASAAAVTVNLSTGTASGGDAAGDTLISIENVIGSGLADTLTAAAAGSHLSGGAGNDVLHGGTGIDTLDGGTGTDNADYSASAAAVSVNLATGVNTGGDADGDTFIGIEDVTGSALADTLTGDANANVLNGGDGDDILIGGAGADTLAGGLGIDTVDYSSSGLGVSINLTTGVGSGGSADGDTLTGIETVIGSDFNDTLTGDAGVNTLRGGAGDDTLAGRGGADVLDGGDGSNTVDYSASTGAVYVNLATSSKATSTGVTVAAAAGKGSDAEGDTYIAIQNVTGSAYDDFVYASAGGGRINAGAGSDSIYAGAGADTVDGGAGSDLVSYEASNAGVTINLLAGTAAGGFATGDVLTNVERIFGSTGADTLTGNAAANALWGADGSDTIEGLAGADTLDGGNGIDTVTYANSAQGVTVDLTLTTAQISAGDASDDVLSNFENLIGSAYNDVLTGDASANVITGEAGDDTLQGGAGADTLDGGSGSDTASYAASTDGVTVDLGVTGAQTSTGDADGDVLTAIENVIGSALADTLAGDGADNSLSGGAGDDTLAGLGGIDVLDGGDGLDSADYSASADAVTVNLSLGTGVGGDAQGDTLTAIENIIGSALDDTLTGDAQTNTLQGGDGNDTLAGLGGADVIDGGAGSNTINYSASAAAVTVNLSSANGVFANAGTGIGGDAQGDSLANIQNLIGSAYADFIYANEGGGTITSGAGSDTVVAGAGVDRIDGGAGTDLVNYSQSTASVTVNLTTGVNSGGYAAGDVLTGVENITGTNYNDTLTGDGAANILTGGSGNDTIEGGAGNDTLDGGAGTDTLSYASATSAVRLMPNYYGWTYPNGVQTQVFYAYNTVGAGSDITSGFENITGSNYSDIINLAYAGTQVNAGSGNDLIADNSNWGLIDGGAGIDTVTFGNNNSWGGVTVNIATDTTSSSRSWGGSATGDWFTGIENLIGSVYNDYLAGDSGANAIGGAAGSDWLRGAGGNDVLFGGTGDDLLIGGTGSDALIGGTGVDTASWSGSSSGVTASLATGTAYGGDAGTQGAATAYANASLVAGWGFSEGSGTTATAISGSQTVILKGTTSWVTGEAGHGSALNFNGAGSGDYATISNIQAADAFTVSVSLKVDTLNSTNGVWKLGTSTGGYFTWLRVNANGSLTYEVRGDVAGATATAQSTAAITTAAGAVSVDQWVNVTVTYQAGRLQLYVDGTLVGSTDSTVFLPTSLVWNNSALGYDYRGTGGVLDGQIDDFAVFNTALTEAEVQQLATQSTGLETAGLVTDTLSGIENLTGTDYADTLTGDAGDNVLDGGLGNDTLQGGAGSDTLIGGAGSDVLNGGADDDIVSYAGSTVAVTVNLETQTASGGYAQGDTLTGIEGVIGSARNDTLTASDTGSTLTGGAGNDTLTGGRADDTIKGDDDLGKLVTYAGTAAAGTNLLVNGNFESYSISRLNGGVNLTASGANGWQTSNGTIYITDSTYIANGTADNQSLRLQGGLANNYVWQNVTTTAGETYLLQFNLGGLTTNLSPVGVYFNGTLLDTIYGGAISQKWATYDYLVTGTGGSDKIEFKYLSTSDQVLIDDVIFTVAGGEDVIDGGAGNDDIDGGYSNDVIQGGEGDDHVVGGLGNDTIDGGTGNDTISGDSDALSAPGLETFSSGTSGWDALSGAFVSTTALLDGNAVLGLIAGSGSNSSWVTQIEKSYQLTDTAAANTTVSFDLYLLDTFDAGEGAKVYVNGTAVLTIIAPSGSSSISSLSDFTITTVDGASYTASLTRGNYSAASVSTDIKLSITLTVSTPGSVLTLGFGSNMNSSVADESFAVDNVSVPGSGIVGDSTAAGDDVITGGAGDDTIDGGAGSDRAIFAGSRSAYTVTYDSASLNYSISGPDGNDTVKHVEKFTFDDGTLTAAQLIAGLDITASATSIAENGAAGTAAGQLAMADGVSVTYAITGGADAALFTLDGSTIKLASGASLDHEVAGAREIQVTATTADGSTHIETIVITVTDVNEAPVITSASSFSRVENGTAIATMRSTDPDAGATKSWSISGADAALFVINQATGALSFVAAPNYENPQDAGSDNVYNLTVSVSDGTNTTSQNVAVTVTNLNEAPVLTLTGTGAVAENAVAATVATLSVVDPDSGDSISYALSGADATLFVIDNGVLRLADGVSLNYEDATTRTVTVTATDAAGLQSAQTLTVNVTNVNEAPTNTSASTFTIAENAATVATLASTDPDAGATKSWSISGADAALFVINQATGALSFVAAPNYENPQDAGSDNVYNLTVSVSDGTNTTSQNVAVTVTNLNEAPVLTLTGTGAVAENAVAATVATLSVVDPDSGDSISYALSGADATLFVIDNGVLRLADGVSLNYEDATTRTVTVTATDAAGLQSAQTLTVNVQDVNEAPVISSATTFSVAEGAIAVASLLATDQDAGASKSWSISGTDAGLFHIDSATGVLTFVSAPDYEQAQDNGANNHYDLTVSVSDGSNTTSQTIAVTVNNVDEIPTLTLTGIGAVSENIGGATVANLAANDQDGGTTLTYSLSGTDASLFMVDGATIRLKDGVAFDYESKTSYSFDLTVSDGSNSVTKSLSVSVTDVNEAPTITSAATFSLVEDGTAVATMAATDPDAGATAAWTISGTDAAAFHIDSATGVLSFVSAPDFENPTDSGSDNVYNLTVTVSDGTNSSSQVVAVTVNDVNDAPVISSVATAQTVEHSTAVITLTATDADGDAITWSIAGGADAAKFQIDASSGALSFQNAPSYDSPTDAGANNVYDVQVRASDGTVSTVHDLAVSVIRDERPPEITSSGAVSVAEGSTAVMTVVAVDPNAGDTTIWSIAGGADAGLFQIDASTGVLSFLSGPNFEAPSDAGGNNVYDVTVQAQDQGGLSSTKAIVVTVSDVNEAPVFSTPVTLSAAEQQTAVVTLVATDPERSAVTYSIVGGADQSLFTVNTQTGELVFVAAQDFANPGDADHDGIYEVTVSGSDGSVASQRTFTVTLTDTNQAPSITSTNAVSVSENTTAVLTVTTADPDQGAVLTYAIAGGADANLFMVDAQTGALSFRSAPNYEASSDAGHDNVYNVTVLVTDGEIARTQAVTITVTDVAEAPAITSSTTAVVNEGQTAVATVTASDQDGSLLSFAVSGGADANLFEIDAQTGALTFKTAPNYETADDADGDNVYDVKVTVSDGTLTSEQTLAVTVANLAPQITSGSVFSIDENNKTVGSIFALDAVGGTLTYALSGTNADLFAIDSHGALSFRSDADYENPLDANGDNSYDLNVLVMDGDRVTTQAITVSVADVTGETVTGTSGADTLHGGIGNDHLVGLDGGDILFGGADNDVLEGGAGNDTLHGGAGDDLLMAGSGTDVLDGGAGTDTVDYSGSLLGVTANLADGAASHGDGQSDTYTEIENLVGSAHDDTLTGDGGDNVLSGQAGSDHLDGGSGNDTLTGGAGTDFLSGGDGDDVLYTDLSDIAVVGGAGSDTAVFTEAGSPVLTGYSGIETLDFGNGGSDTVEIGSSILTDLAPENDLLTINRDSTDSVTLTGATDTNSHVDVSGITYDVYTMDDDNNNQITIHLQAA
jgi:VCBS repeat-containing protein